MEPSSVRVAFQGLVLFILFLVLAVFTAEFYIYLFSEQILENCKASTDDILMCHREALLSWPYRQILFVSASITDFVISIVFGFLFTKQYAENKHKNLIYLAFSASFYRVVLSVIDSSLEALELVSFLIVALIIYSGLLLGHDTRSKIFDKRLKKDAKRITTKT